MAVDNAAPGPGETAPAAVPSSPVQVAIDAHVATYKTQLEAKIKAQLADVKVGWQEVSGDVKSIVTGAAVTIGTGSAAHALPRWVIWGGLVLVIVGGIALGGVVLAHLPIKL